MQAGQFITVVYNDFSEVSGMLGTRDSFTVEVMTMFDGVRHIPWPAIRCINVGPDDGFVFHIIDDDGDDDGDGDDVEPEDDTPPPDSVAMKLPKFTVGTNPGSTFDV